MKNRHSRGLLCPSCRSNLKAVFYYTQFGVSERAGDFFYCDDEKKFYRITIDEVKL